LPIREAHHRVGFSDFYDESLFDFMFTEAGYDIHLMGDSVWLFDTSPTAEHPHWSPPSDIDTATWFDPDTGTLTVPNPETGDTLATITCNEIRNSIDDAAYEIGPYLTDFPEQNLWYSPDGPSVRRQRRHHCAPRRPQRRPPNRRPTRMPHELLPRRATLRDLGHDAEQPPLTGKTCSRSFNGTVTIPQTQTQADMTLLGAPAPRFSPRFRLAQRYTAPPARNPPPPRYRVWVSGVGVDGLEPPTSAL
jgi:hypothetical protein